MDAHVMPLPSALVTPPVTKMYRRGTVTGFVRRSGLEGTRLMMLTAKCEFAQW